METSNEYLERAMGRFNQKQSRKGTVSKEPVKRKQNEWSEQLVFCKYIKAKHPNLIYRSDLHSAGKKTVFMQGLVKILQSSSGFPDTQIYELRGKYCGLMIELKKKPETQSDSIYKIDGTYKANDHIDNQLECHRKLIRKGWVVKFAEGADQAIEYLEKYLKL